MKNIIYPVTVNIAEQKIVIQLIKQRKMVEEIQISMRRRTKQLKDFILNSLKVSDLELTHPTDITRKVNVSTWLDELKKIAVYGCIDETNIEIVIQGVRAIIVHVQDIVSRNVKDEFEKTNQVIKHGDQKIETLTTKLEKERTGHEKTLADLIEKHTKELEELKKKAEEKLTGFVKDIQKLEAAIKEYQTEIAKLKKGAGYGF